MAGYLVSLLMGLVVGSSIRAHAGALPGPASDRSGWPVGHIGGGAGDRRSEAPFRTSAGSDLGLSAS
jgi:hypothetical protein